MSNTIAVIGLGVMGAAMAKNLANRGFLVRGYDISEDARDRLTKAGGNATQSIKEAIDGASIVFTSLPNTTALRQVVTALSDSVLEGRVVVEVSTFAITDKENARVALEEVGCTLLDCPVSGTGPQALAAELTVFASGNERAYRIAKPALEAISKDIRYLGAFGSGSTLKFIANHLVTIHNAATAEALVLAKKAGLDMNMVYDAIKDSAATSKMFQVRGKMIAEGNYVPHMRISTYQKDLDIIGSFANGLQCPTPLFNVSSQLYLAAQSQGLGDLDTAAVAKVIEALAGAVGPT
jgi:L-threonate 2-dehydrogenase